MTPRVIVHAGVDTPISETMLRVLGDAARAALELLERGGSPVAAAAGAVCVLEDEPGVNAGYGSVLNELGDVEADAAVVDGARRRFAAVAALAGIRNPVRAAQALLEDTAGPVLLVGDGARRFALDAGLSEADLRTEGQRRIWEHVRRHGMDGDVSPFTGQPVGVSETVGAIVAADGHLGVAASTGGVLFKRAGRVGDAAVYGAGIYADGASAALCSGNGEAGIELHLALRTCLGFEALGPAGAVEWGVAHGQSEKGMRGGIVAYDLGSDEVAAAHNADSFPIVTATGTVTEIVDATPITAGVR